MQCLTVSIDNSGQGLEIDLWGDVIDPPDSGADHGVVLVDLLLPALVVGDVQASHVTHQNSPSLGLLADEAVNGLPDVGVVAQQLVENSVE